MFVHKKCIFCDYTPLVIRHVDTECYQVVCVGCGATGPMGKCTHDAKEMYEEGRTANG
jgi:hypothetical protein